MPVRVLEEDYWFGPSASRSDSRPEDADFPPLPVLHGERVGVRGRIKPQHLWPPLTLALSPLQVQSNGERGRSALK